jgi:PAS domain S-box-containing protein
MSPEEVVRLLHELSVRQLELETENEELLGAAEVGVAYRENLERTVAELTEANQRLKGEAEELRQIERALREDAANHRLMVETANEGIWAMDGNQLTTYVNRVMADMLGYKRTEMLGRPVESFMFAEDLSDHEEKMEKRRQGESTRFERRFRRKDGSEVWTQVSGTPLLDAAGLFRGSFGMLTDITKHKQARAALEESLSLHRATLEAIFRAAPVGLGLLKNRVFVMTNEQMAQMTGYTSAELQGLSARRLYASEAEFNRVGTQKYRDIREKGIGTLETEWRRRDGSLMDVLLCSSFIDPSDETAGVVATALDVTARRQAEKELKQYRDRLEQLVVERTAALTEVNEELSREIVEH